MPVLPKPDTETYIDLPARKAQVAYEADVLVVGGGPAGMGAALGAAQTGANVVLAERHGFLGGNATAALVNPLMSFHTNKHDLIPKYENSGGAGLLPSDHGPGEKIVGGALDMLLRNLIEAGGALNPTVKTGYVVPFDPEIFKYVSMELLHAAGVKYLFHAFATEVIDPPEIKGVVFETKSGPVVIKAKAVVDCTGDGDIAARAGAPFEIGRPSDGFVQPMTLMFRMGEFMKSAFDNYTREHPGQWRGVHGLWDLIEKAEREDGLDLQRDDLLFFGSPHEKELSVNSTRIRQVLGTDVWDLSYAEFEGRRQMRRIVKFFNKHVPGFEKAYAIQSGVTVGVRETRRIMGEYHLEVDDILEARQFKDTIAKSSYPVDIHDPLGKGTVLKRLPPGKSYGIPLRSLMPQKVKRLVVAGRCISGSHEAHSSYRVMPTSMATGQGAGVCAALAVKNNKLPRDINPQVVREELRRQGAIID